LKILDHVPTPLLSDIVAGRCIPIVGAGFSTNAVVPQGKKIPLWDELGKQIASILPDYPYSTPIDATSAFCQEYSRTKLVEILTQLLFVGSAQPGASHLAFCQLPFDIVCTTNFDFLLEKAYDVKPHATYCRPVLDEDQLSIAPSEPGVLLIKLHGDLHHPNRLIVTEEDYDTFISRYPLLSTYLGNLLITRTPLFIGYSLEDPDFRQIWQVIGDRLHRMRRSAYVLTVSARATEIARYQRRGVKAVDLPGKKIDYGRILETFFNELRVYWSSQLIKSSTITDESLGELSLPEGATTRLCFFAIPLSLHSFYKSNVFPIAESYGLIPMTSESVVSPGDNILAKITALLDRTQILVADASTTWVSAEIEMVVRRRPRPKILLILPEEASSLLQAKLRPVLDESSVIHRPRDLSYAPSEFLERIEDWFQKAAQELRLQVAGEPQRLLQKREYRASIISAMTLLESTFIESLYASNAKEKPPLPMYRMLAIAREKGIITQTEQMKLKDYWAVRTNLVHTQTSVRASKAREIVQEIISIISRIKQEEHGKSR